ncbi:MAG: hypothetical protein JRI23_00905 [Deltaproteobacteria bacterium]|jgi:hypothetical protein|nr:hypothetical protein [Deltaproteobacteria bacterium]MBW2530012.1 hypothetical protein [Deltaproteobacteria bacterium]
MGCRRRSGTSAARLGWTGLVAIALATACGGAGDDKATPTTTTAGGAGGETTSAGGGGTGGAVAGGGGEGGAGGETTGYRRPFGPAAPWNVPVAGLPRHSSSDTYAGLLYDDAPAEPGNINIGYGEYTYPVYYAADATDTYTVDIEWSSNIDGATVPWNPSWQANAGTDGQIILLDAAQGIEYDFWQVTFDHGAKLVRATNGSRVGADEAEPTAVGNYWDKVNGWRSSRGCGIQYFAMLVVPEEVAAGAIEHALSMPIRNTDGSEFVPPATKLEHPGNPPGIPEGMRFALEITDGEIQSWLGSLPTDLSPGMLAFAEIMAVALRDYGWFITDTAGGAKFQLEAQESALDEWEALGLAAYEASDYKEYPRDLLDGLITPERIYAIVPSDQYP